MNPIVMTAPRPTSTSADPRGMRDGLAGPAKGPLRGPGPALGPQNALRIMLMLQLDVRGLDDLRPIFATSAFWNSLIWSIVMSAPCMPSLAMRFAHVGLGEDLRDLVCSRSTMGLGVPAGAKIACHDNHLVAGHGVRPRSARSASSAGASAKSPRARAACRSRCAGRRRRWCRNIMSTWPAITSWIAGPLPLYGMCVMSMPALDLSSSSDRCCEVPCRRGRGQRLLRLRGGDHVGERLVGARLVSRPAPSGWCRSA